METLSGEFFGLNQPEGIPRKPLVVIFDIGRSYVRAGLAGTLRISYVERHSSLTQSGKALSRSEALRIAEKLIGSAFRKGLPAVNDNSKQQRIVWLSASLSLPAALIKACATVLFSDQYEFDCVCHLPTPAAALTASPVQTGFILDVGGQGTSFSGLIDGFIVQKSIVKTSIGGDAITHALRCLMLEWYSKCGSIYSERLEHSMEKKHLVDAVPKLSRTNWSFADYDTLKTLEYLDWCNIKSMTAFATDSTDYSEGKLRVEQDGFAPIRGGTIVVAVPRSIRYLCTEVLFRDAFEIGTNAKSGSGYCSLVDGSLWNPPYSHLLQSVDEEPFSEYMRTIHQDDYPTLGPAQRLFLHLKAQYKDHAILPTEDNQGLLRAIVTSLERCSALETSLICQNIITCGGGSELLGLSERLSNDLRTIYEDVSKPPNPKVNTRKHHHFDAISFTDSPPDLEHWEDDPFPSPSYKVGQSLHKWKLANPRFAPGALGWIGASMSASITLMNEDFSQAITDMGRWSSAGNEPSDSFEVKESNSTISSSSSLEAPSVIPKASQFLESLPKQILFRSTFNANAYDFEFSAPEFALSNYNAEKSVYTKCYNPGYDLLGHGIRTKAL